MFTCKKCNYSTNDKSNFNKHHTTKKHLKRHNKLEENKPSQVFFDPNCQNPVLTQNWQSKSYCDKSFKSKSHLKDIKRIIVNKIKHLILIKICAIN